MPSHTLLVLSEYQVGTHAAVIDAGAAGSTGAVLSADVFLVGVGGSFELTAETADRADAQDWTFMFRHRGSRLSAGTGRVRGWQRFIRVTLIVTGAPVQVSSEAMT